MRELKGSVSFLPEPAIFFTVLLAHGTFTKQTGKSDGQQCADGVSCAWQCLARWDCFNQLMLVDCYMKYAQSFYIYFLGSSFTK